MSAQHEEPWAVDTNMLHMTTDDNNYAFEFTYHALDDALHSRLSLQALERRGRGQWAQLDTFSADALLLAPRERPAQAQGGEELKVLETAFGGAKRASYCPAEPFSEGPCPIACESPVIRQQRRAA